MSSSAYLKRYIFYISKAYAISGASAQAAAESPVMPVAFYSAALQ